jgi:frataxin
MDQYHKLSDTTMEVLLEDLENLLDEIANSSFEVEYHVCLLFLLGQTLTGSTV